GVRRSGRRFCARPRLSATAMVVWNSNQVARYRALPLALADLLFALPGAQRRAEMEGIAAGRHLHEGFDPYLPGLARDPIGALHLAHPTRPTALHALQPQLPL